MSLSLRSVRDPVVAALTGLFAHGPTPLKNTLDHPGDPGILGPDSVSWRVLGADPFPAPPRNSPPGSPTIPIVAQPTRDGCAGVVAWRVALLAPRLVRCGAPVPAGLFRQPLPSPAQIAP